MDNFDGPVQEMDSNGPSQRDGAAVLGQQVMDLRRLELLPCELLTEVFEHALERPEFIDKDTARWILDWGSEKSRLGTVAARCWRCTEWTIQYAGGLSSLMELPAPFRTQYLRRLRMHVEFPILSIQADTWRTLLEPEFDGGKSRLLKAFPNLRALTIEFWPPDSAWLVSATSSWLVHLMPKFAGFDPILLLCLGAKFPEVSIEGLEDSAVAAFLQSHLSNQLEPAGFSNNNHRRRSSGLLTFETKGTEAIDTVKARYEELWTLWCKPYERSAETEEGASLQPGLPAAGLLEGANALAMDEDEAGALDVDDHEDLGPHEDVRGSRYNENAGALSMDQDEDSGDDSGYEADDEGGRRMQFRWRRHSMTAWVGSVRPSLG